MGFTRHHLVLGLAGGALAAIGAASFAVLDDAPNAARSDSPSSATAVLVSADDASSALVRRVLPDEACASELIHQEVEALRVPFERRAAALERKRVALQIDDPNPADANTAVFLRAGPADIAALQRRLPELEARVVERSAHWQQVLERSVDEFRRTAPKDPSSCGVGIYYGMLQSNLDEIARLRAAHAEEAMRMIDAQDNVRSFQKALVASAVYAEQNEFATTRATIAELSNPQTALDAYRKLKADYLAAKQNFDDAQQRYIVARNIPLPPQRTKDWRLPKSATP